MKVELHLQRGEVIVQGPTGRPGARSKGLGTIHPGLDGILGVQARRGEAAIRDLPHKCGELRRIGRKLRNLDLRAAGPNGRPLHGIVVDEDQGIHADVELAGDIRDILRLGQPVGPHADEVLLVKDGVGMLPERLQGVLLVVLRGDGQEHPLPGEPLCGDLDIPVDGADAVVREEDSVQPILADDPAPEGPVQVQDQAFPACPPQDVFHARNLCGEARLAPGGEGQGAEVPRLRIVEILPPRLGGELLDIEHRNAQGLQDIPPAPSGAAFEVQA